MKERKNIDRLFQEKLKDFEAVPPENLWKNIAEKLKEKKKKRRVIPIWWKLSGVAAIFILGWSELNYYNNTLKTNPIIEQNVVDGNNTESSIQSNENNEIENDSQNALVNNPEENSVSPEDNSIVLSNESSSTVKKKSSTDLVDAALANEKKSDANQPNDLISKPKLFKEKKSEKELNKLYLAQQNKPLELENNESKKITESSKNEKHLLEDKNIKIVTQISDSISLTVIAETEKEPNALEELLKEKEEKPIVELKANKWKITSTVAPVYLGSTSNGSPIDEEFANNSKDYQNSLSYGLGINYALSKKVNLRTGINRLNMSYNTNDIMFYPELSGRAMRNIASNVNASTVIVVRDNLIDPKASSAIQGKEEGHIQQRMGYIEVPLEVSYKIINKKISLNIIGGMSSLFLNDNSLMVVSDNISADLGRATNLSNFHFSTNIGFGVNYDFWKSFQIQVEPILKYQFNTFTNDVGGFRPYVFGIYSGLSYKF